MDIDYSSSILSQWARKNIKSLEDVEIERGLRSKKSGASNKTVKPAPEWSNTNETESTELSEERKKELRIKSK